MPRTKRVGGLADQNNRTAIRRIQMLLTLLPYPRKVSVRYVIEQLENKGHLVTERTVQRDLIQLSCDFGIVSDGKVPASWGWAQNCENPFQTLGLDWATAIVFRLSEQYLQNVLPRSAIKYLKPYFQEAGKTLSRDSKAKNWVSRIRVLDRGLSRIPPPISSKIEALLNEAMLNDKQVEIHYENTAGEKKDYTLNIYGLVSRGGLLYLVGCYGQLVETRMFALHRIKEIEVLPTKNFVPSHFNFDKAIADGGLGFPVGDKKIGIHLRMSDFKNTLGFEVKISQDQRVEQKPDGIHLFATVPDNMELRWWILGFGNKAEVLAPVGLRDEIRNNLVESLKKYSSD